MQTPSLDEVRRLAAFGNLVPVYREVLADLETPVSAYLKVAGGAAGRPGSYLLESVEGGERLARYSFIGSSPYLTARVRGGRVALERDGVSAEHACADPLDVVRDELARHRAVEVPGLPRFHGGAVGYLAYECARRWEDLPAPANDPHGLPEAMFLFADTILVFDHLRHRIQVVSHARIPDHPTDGEISAAYDAAVERIDATVERLHRPSPLAANGHDGGLVARLDGRGGFDSNLTQPQFEEMVVRAKRYIQDGDIIQVVLSQRLSRPTTAAPFSIYRALRTVNPSPYMYYLDLGDCHVVGASPEMLVRVEDGVVSTHPIAGTRRRGRDPRGGRGARGRASVRREGAGRARHAPRPRPERRRPGERGRGRSGRRR